MSDERDNLVIGGLRDPDPNVRQVWINYLKRQTEIEARRDYHFADNLTPIGWVLLGLGFVIAIAAAF